MVKSILLHISMIMMIMSGTLMNSCTKSIDDTDLLNIKWIFVEGEDDGFIFEYIEEIFIEFSADEASGFGGCNMFWFKYTRSDCEIEVSELTYTEIACEIEITEIENKFFKLIGKAESLKIEDGVLTIFCENGKLKFVKE